MQALTRIEQRDELITEFGMLVGPVRTFIFDEAIPVSAAPFIRSRFNEEFGKFKERMHAYCWMEGFHFARERDKITDAIRAFGFLLDELADGQVQRVEAQRRLDGMTKRALTVIRQVPCDAPTTVIPPISPLSAYYRLRAECASATNRLQIFDAYLGPDVFHRYLREVKDAVDVTLVTDRTAFSSPKADVRRRDSVIAISELWSVERPNRYAFLVCDLHGSSHSYR